jgi:CubicO group peptidase (beta-lactamase class C family)
LAEQVERAATESGFSGVVRVDRGGAAEVLLARGLADRARGVAMTPDTRLAIASGTKGFTALAAMSLVADGTLALTTPVRELLRDDLPLVAADVTVGHLVAHTSGIGDYLDEDENDFDVSDYLMPVPVHRLRSAEDYLAVLGGYDTRFPAGERFTYNNGGYVVLAIVIERASGVPYHDLVHQRVLGPAGLADTCFPRSDSPTGADALGYVEVDGAERLNVLHLPLRGVGDGGMATTVADMHRFWEALFAGRILPAETVATMVRSQRETDDDEQRYGLGFWVTAAGAPMLIGSDAGISFRSEHDPVAGTTYTVIGNTSNGAWPVGRAVREAFSAGM